MVGREGDPASDAIHQKSIDGEYDFGTVEDSEYANKVFEDAKYFGGGDGRYRAAGIEVEVTDEGIEYDVTQEVDDKIAQEFVEGIIRSFEGGDDEGFRSRVKEEKIRTIQS